MIELHKLIKREDKLLLGIDPGNTTGFIFFNESALYPLLRAWEEKIIVDNQYNWDIIINLIAALPKNSMIVMENYRVYSNKLQRHSFSEVPTLRLIGGIMLKAHEHNIPIIFQMAQTAKQFITDDKLAAWGLLKSTTRHSRDALRHVLYYCITKKNR